MYVCTDAQADAVRELFVWAVLVAGQPPCLPQTGKWSKSNALTAHPQFHTFLHWDGDAIMIIIANRYL